MKPDSYVVDTHTLIWHLEGSRRLGDNARAAMSDPSSVLYLPLIALAEACWIVEHGRTLIPSASQLLQDVDADPRIELCSLDRETLGISLQATAIPEMHDRLIVATALRLSAAGRAVAILSRDETIAQQAPVSVVW